MLKSLNLFVAAGLWWASVAGAQPLPQNEPTTLPAGLVPNTETIICPPHVSGFLLQGHGRGAINNKWNTGHATYVMRRGGSTDPMVRVTGSDHTLCDFSLYGEDPEKPTGRRPSAGVLMAYEPGVGTGSSVLERLHVYYCRSAFQFGAEAADNMCDTTTVRDSSVGHCDYAFHQVGGQAISNSFVNNETHDLRKAVFRIEGGGNLYTANNSLTKVGAGDQVAVWHFSYPSKYLGHNHWNYTDINFKADNQCGDRVEYVRMEGPGGIGLVSINPQFAHPERGNGKYTFFLHDGARIKIEGGSGLLTKHSIFVVDHPKFDPPEIMAELHDQCCDPQEMLAPGSGPVRLTLHGCYKPVGGGVQKRFNFYRVVEGAED